MNEKEIINEINFFLSKKKKIEKEINSNKKLKEELIKINNILSNLNKILNIEKEIISIKEMYNEIYLQKLIDDELEILNNKKNILKNDIENLIKIFNKNIGCFIEIRSGTGGKESSLFINDLYKMYLKYSLKKLWDVKTISKINNYKGGYKEIIIQINNNLSYDNLKLESGGHRVQRIPETESKGRIHTSTCTVAILPILPKKKFKSINPCDLKIDSFKSSGAGGQHVNTTDSAIRITHIPSGLIVECQDERSQHKNKSKAISVLQSRLYIMEKEKIEKEENKLRKILIGSGYRSDRIRTYNFIQNRITDHRSSINIYNLNEILNGNLDLLIKRLKNNL